MAFIEGQPKIKAEPNKQAQEKTQSRQLRDAIARLTKLERQGRITYEEYSWQVDAVLYAHGFFH